jgi:hypothetical protein
VFRPGYASIAEHLAMPSKRRFMAFGTPPIACF